MWAFLESIVRSAVLVMNTTVKCWQNDGCVAYDDIWLWMFRTRGKVLWQKKTNTRGTDSAGKKTVGTVLLEYSAWRPAFNVGSIKPLRKPSSTKFPAKCSYTRVLKHSLQIIVNYSTLQMRCSNHLASIRILPHLVGIIFAKYVSFKSETVFEIVSPQMTSRTNTESYKWALWCFHSNAPQPYVSTCKPHYQLVPASVLHLCT